MGIEQVYDLMERADGLPYGQPRTMLVEEALRHAEAAGEELLAFQIRAELRVVYVHGGEPAKALTAFSRCLSDFDRDPSRFEESDELQLLWAFKGTVSALIDFPEVPLDRTFAVLDDMERRYKQGGHGLHPVHAYRCVVAMHIGDDEAADRAYADWNSAPRTQLSDCVGCDPGTKVGYLAWRDRDDDALALAEPVLRAELTCSEQPQSMLTMVMPVLLRDGRHAQAADAHRRAYRVQRTRISELWAIAAHLKFCARTGNEARGLEILERHLGWLDSPPTPHDAMAFAAAASLLLRRLGETGHGDARLHRPEHAGRPAAQVAVAALGAELAGYALDLAERFDARNGTDHQGDQIRRTLEAEPLIDHLALAPHAARRPTAVPARLPDLPDGDDPAGLLDVAEERWARQDSESALAAWRRFDERTAGIELTPAQAGRRADGLGFERLLRDDLAGALREWSRAATLHAEVGDLAREQSAISRRGAVLAGQGRPDEGLPLLESAATALAEHEAGTRRALTAAQRLADAYAQADRPDDALAVLDGITAEATLDAADLEHSRARALLARGEGSGRAEAALRRACAGYRTAEAPAALAQAAFLLAQLLIRRDEHDRDAEYGGDDEIRGLLDEAITSAPPHWPELRSIAHATRGGWLLARERPDEAADDLVEAVAGFTAEGRPEAAYCRLDLAAAYLGCGRHLAAAEVAEEAAPLLAALGDPQAERRSRYLLGRAQSEMGEKAEAADTFTALAADEDDPLAAGRLLESASELLAGLDKDGLAAERFGSASAAFAAAGDLHGVVRTRRRRAMSLLWSGHGDAGLEAIGRARAALVEARAAQAGDPDEAVDHESTLRWQGTMLDYDEARIRASLGDDGAAVALLDVAVEGFTLLEEKEAARTAADLRSEISRR